MPQARIMGVINVTPDSFSDGGRLDTPQKAIEHGLCLAEEGADILDIGGESTRPNSEPVPLEVELNRVIPVVKGLASKVPSHITLSVDTVKPEVALAAVNAGATLVNDVSGFRDEKMVEVAAQTGVEVCCMHMQGTPKTMQKDPVYPRGVVSEIKDWFQEKVTHLTKSGVDRDKIILDPGIGFGKTTGHCFEILAGIRELKALGFPILIGLSRKSFMTRTLGKMPTQLLSATIAMNTIALISQADIIRVHDVAEHRDVVDMVLPFLRHCEGFVGV